VGVIWSARSDDGSSEVVSTFSLKRVAFPSIDPAGLNANMHKISWRSRKPRNDLRLTVHWSLIT